jgi:DNA-binding NtrC family response regulator
VRGIVETHRGFITVATVLGRGTTFRVYLPAEKSAIVADTVAALPMADSVNSELILLVDDEEFIRETVSSILKRARYRVLVARDGREALLQFNAHLGEISLVITDRDMPIVDGAGLAEAIHERCPAMKLLLMSGLGSSDDKGKECPETFGDAFIAKPFTVEALLKSVEQLLLQPSSTGGS